MMERTLLKLLIKNLRLNSQRHYVRGTRLTPNPGIERQLKIYSDKKSDAPNFHEEYEDSEADFMTASQQHKHWEKEGIRHKERISNAIVKNKYFKEKLPNFLTWSEKEQIRQLYTEDPDEWNYEKLSDSFPADVETIAKVVKSKWSPNDEKRIENHDNIVKRNWELFKQNNEKINPRLAVHLKRFINRENFQGINLQSIKLAKQKDILKLHQPKSNEFSSIITGLNAHKFKELPEQKTNNAAPRFEASKNLTIGSNKPITLARLKHLNNDMKSEIVTNSENDKKVNIHLDGHIDLLKVDDGKEINQMVQVEVESADIIKENIKIPKKLWKEGATYRIKDCFYDCDGEFLYRVPGMRG